MYYMNYILFVCLIFMHSYPSLGRPEHISRILQAELQAYIDIPAITPLYEIGSGHARLFVYFVLITLFRSMRASPVSSLLGYLWLELLCS